MTRQQRYRYEMFVRVRDFGAAHKELFPESSTGGQWFAEVSGAVAAIDGHLKNRIVAVADSRRVKSTTRAAVLDYMKTIALTARQVTKTDSVSSRFRMPRRRSLKVEISTARVFVEEAAKRQGEFARYGLPPTFISEFQALVDTMQQAVDTRLSSKTTQRQSRQGIVTELARGLDVIRELDATVVIATRRDPVRLAAWQTARRIEGQGSSSLRTVTLPANVAAASSPAPSSVDPPVAEIANPPAVEVAPPTSAVTPVLVVDERLERAS